MIFNVNIADIITLPTGTNNPMHTKNISRDEQNLRSSGILYILSKIKNVKNRMNP